MFDMNMGHEQAARREDYRRTAENRRQGEEFRAEKNRGVLRPLAMLNRLSKLVSDNNQPTENIPQVQPGEQPAHLNQA